MVYKFQTANCFSAAADRNDGIYTYSTPSFGLTSVNFFKRRVESCLAAETAVKGNAQKRLRFLLSCFQFFLYGFYGVKIDKVIEVQLKALVNDL